MHPAALNLHRIPFPAIILFVAMLALSGCSSSKLNDRSLDQYIAEQERAEPAPPKPSIDYLNQADKPLAPGSGEVYRLLEAKQYKQAHAVTTQMLASDLASPAEKAEYYLFRGVTNRLLVNEKAGYDDLNQSIELNPLDWRAYNARRELYENRSMHKEAAEDWEKAKELNPDLKERNSELSDYRVHGGVI